MFVAKTLLTGQAVYFHARSVEEIADWAAYHNLQFTEGTPTPGQELFSAHAADGSPLTEGAVHRLRQCVFRPDLTVQLPLGGGVAEGQVKKWLATQLTSEP